MTSNEKFSAAYKAMEARHAEEMKEADDTVQSYWRVYVGGEHCNDAKYGYDVTVYESTAWIKGTGADALAYAHGCEMTWLDNPPGMEDDEVDKYLARLEEYDVSEASKEDYDEAVAATA